MRLLGFTYVCCCYATLSLSIFAHGMGFLILSSIPSSTKVHAQYQISFKHVLKIVQAFVCFSWVFCKQSKLCIKCLHDFLACCFIHSLTFFSIFVVRMVVVMVVFSILWVFLLLIALLIIFLLITFLHFCKSKKWTFYLFSFKKFILSSCRFAKAKNWLFEKEQIHFCVCKKWNLLLFSKESNFWQLARPRNELI